MMTTLTTLTTLVLALRGAAAVAVLSTLAGGLPRIVQAGLAVAVGLWAALLAGQALPPVPDGGVWAVAARELVIGATIGVIAALPLLAAAMAGRLVERSSGARTRGPYGALFGILAAAVFVGIDGHVAFVEAIATSFRDVPAIAATRLRVVEALAHLVPIAVRLAIPWLVTAAVVEIAAGVAVRIAGRAAPHAPVGAATPAALVMMTASLVGTLAVAIAAVIR
ncbi:MAG TPA: flagellar biosynthetic protein FliR [Kofleriaceae bacterium]|nr:flagellar biosynthetic protein FliR [Kofleriaceae bacterium]